MIFAQSIFRTSHNQRDLIAVNRYRNDDATGNFVRHRQGIVSEIGKGSVGAAQIGRAHAGKSAALRRERRKIVGHAKNDGVHTGLIQNLPESFALQEAFFMSFGDWQNVRPNGDGVTQGKIHI